MKWRYQNEEQKEEESQQVVTISAAAPTAGAVTKIVENNLYFYGDITESNALELNAALYEMDKKLSVTNVFLDAGERGKCVGTFWGSYRPEKVWKFTLHFAKSIIIGIPIQMTTCCRSPF